MTSSIKYLFFNLLVVTYATCMAQEPILSMDPSFASLVASDTRVEKLASDFKFTEGPVWCDKGYLLFSDIPANIIYKWENNKASVFISPSGNSNGLAFDKSGNLISCEHGTRGLRLSVLSSEESKVLTDTYAGKKFNSPNDLAVKKDGSIYFTDPPYGLAGKDSDTAKQLRFNGVYRLLKDKVTLLDSGFVRPNGIAFSPDEKYLYVAQSEVHPLWKRFEVTQDGMLANGKLFFDASLLHGKGTPDGMKVDVLGNLYCTGPGGVVVFSPEGKHLGTIAFPEVATNCAFGDEDMKTLYVTAQTGLYRVRTKVKGL